MSHKDHNGKAYKDYTREEQQLWHEQNNSIHKRTTVNEIEAPFNESSKRQVPASSTPVAPKQKAPVLN